MATSQPVFPSELLAAICAHISSSQDLAYFARCSRELYNIAVPHLYRNIDLHLPRNYIWRPAGDGQASVTAKRLDIFRSLIKLFIQQPSRAAYVTTLSNRSSFRDGPTRSREGQIERPRRNVVHDEEIEGAIRRYCASVNDAEIWIEDASSSLSDAEDALMALLLSLLPNLECLDLEIESNPSCVQRLFGRALGWWQTSLYSAHLFQYLRRVVWVGDQVKYGVALCAPILALPSIQELYLYRIGFPDPHYRLIPAEYLGAFPNRSSNIEIIQLQDSLLTPDELACLLEAPRALKTFVYNMGTGHLCYETGVSLGQLDELLSLHQSSLEFLWLDHVPDRPPWETVGPSWDQMWGGLGPLSSFEKLCGLRLPADFVFGVEDEFTMATPGPDVQTPKLYALLPAQLKSLHLTYCCEQIGKYLLDSIRYLYERKRDPNVLPSLENVRLDMTMADAEKYHAVLSELLESAQSVGVDMTLMRHYGRDNESWRSEGVTCNWGWNEDLILRECSTGLNKKAPPAVLKLEGGKVTEVPI